MSSLAQDRVVDAIGIAPVTGHVVLTLVDDLDWRDEDAHIRALQAKLNAYLAFIEGGEVFARLEEAGPPVPATTPVTIQIRAACELPARGREFLAYATARFAQLRVQLAHRVDQVP